MELSVAPILIDGVDLSRISLKDLRSTWAVTPHDLVRVTVLVLHDLVCSPTGVCSCYSPAPCGPTWIPLTNLATLGSGTPSNDHIWVTPSPGSNEEGEPEAAASGQFTDAVIEDKGNRLSVGQRSLVSLGSALMKSSKVLILNEVTGTMGPAAGTQEH